MRFSKMQGLGNDFVVFDGLAEGNGTSDAFAVSNDPDHPSTPQERSELARRLCDRRFGIGADGLIFLEAGRAAEYRMTVVNSDGSTAEMCGNGLRCAARLLCEHGHTSNQALAIETDAGVLEVSFTDSNAIRVDAGPATFDPASIGMVADGEFVDSDLGNGRRGTAVAVGNPHLVLFVDDVEAIDLARLGPELEYHPRFPNRINVHIAQVDGDQIRQRTWERGAGLTLACGTGACAVAAAGLRLGRSPARVDVHLPGGMLQIECLANGHVAMTGPASVVYEGEVKSPRLLSSVQVA